MLYSNPYLKFMLEKCTNSKQPGITLGETIFFLQCANAQSVAQQFYPQTDGSQHEDQTQSGPTAVNADPMGPEYFEYNSGGDNSNAVNSLSLGVGILAIEFFPEIKWVCKHFRKNAVLDN